MCYGERAQTKLKKIQDVRINKKEFNAQIEKKISKFLLQRLKSL